MFVTGCNKYSKGYGNFSMPKLYNYVIDFVEGAMLSKLAKVYPLSLAERNSLDTWIGEELRKGYI